MDNKKQTAFFWSVALITIGSLLYSDWPLGFWLNPAAMQSGLASELGAFGQPYNWFFIGADVVCGVFLAVAGLLLLRFYRPIKWAKTAIVLMMVYGLCGALDAVLPLQCLPSLQVCGPVLHDPLLILHGTVDFIGSIALIGTLIVAALYVRRYNQQWQSWIYTVGIAGTLFAVASLVLYIAHGPGYWAQRYYITISSIWIISLPFVLLRLKSTAKPNVQAR